MPLADLRCLGQSPDLALCSPEGRRVKDLEALLSGVEQAETQLEHHLTLSLDLANRWGLTSTWYRVLSDRNFPGVVLLEAVAPGELLELLAPDLIHSSLVFCDPLGRIAAHNARARELLRYVAKGALIGSSLSRLLSVESLLEPDQPPPSEVLVPLDQSASLSLEVLREPYQGGWLVRLSSKPFLSSSIVADWQSLVDHFPGAVLRIDSQGRIQFASRMMGGFSVEEVQGKNVFEFVRADSHMTLDHFRNHVMRDRNTLSGEVPVHDPQSSEPVWYAFQAAPILVNDDVQAVIYAVDISQRVRAEEDLRASQKRVRSLSSRIDQAQEEERRRISRELHDELGGALTALRLELGALEKVENLPSLAKEKLEAVEGILSVTLSTVRRLASQLRPQILDDLGLPAALLALLNDAARRAGFEHEFQMPRDVPGGQDLHLHIYRICQEALTNICRHAQATRVKLRLTRPLHDRLELHIEDNGLGYEGPSLNGATSMGLLGMSERVMLLHGHLAIDTAPGQGCRLKIEIPIDPG